MKHLRHFLILCLIVAVLPWGAFVAAFGPAPAAAATYAAPIQGRQISLPVAGPIKVLAKRKCRIAHLPGSSCGPDLLFHTGAATFGPGNAVPALSRIADWPSPGLIRTPPREPPRAL